MGGCVQQARVSLGATLMRLCVMSPRGMVGQPNLSGSGVAWRSSGFSLRNGLWRWRCRFGMSSRSKAPFGEGPSPFKGSTLNSA